MLNDFKKLAKESYAKNHKAKMLNFERDAIVKTLRECNYNISEASKWLGYSRQHMYKKMEALGIRVIEDEGNRELRGYRRKIDFLQGFKFSKEERAVLDDLLDIWQDACSDAHEDCNNCPRQTERCRYITDRLISRIYDKN